MLDDEERARERADQAWQAREHPFLDDYHLARSPDWSKIEVPLLSAGNWGGAGLHLRSSTRGFVDPPLRAVEVRGPARFVEQGVPETALRIAARYLGPEEGAADVESLRGADVIVRIEPGDIRVWDYADEFGTS
jgi:hypothetical protein